MGKMKQYYMSKTMDDMGLTASRIIPVKYFTVIHDIKVNVRTK